MDIKSNLSYRQTRLRDSERSNYQPLGLQEPKCRSPSVKRWTSIGIGAVPDSSWSRTKPNRRATSDRIDNHATCRTWLQCQKWCGGVGQACHARARTPLTIKPCSAFGHQRETLTGTLSAFPFQKFKLLEPHQLPQY